ncbi:MAG TPA: ABC transporter substrate-binding protein [Candidatus Cybelea sp.]|nr:ABC transporter substrate-binding protein [Candidatus Cybelea sp.]
MQRTTMLALALGLSVAGAAAASAQTLRIGLAEDPDILDPTQGRTFVGRIVFASLCDKLFDITPDLKVVPQLALSYAWSEDAKHLTIQLRKGVKFQDGEAFNAAAAKFNFERHINMPGSNRKGELSAVQTVDVVDDSTVRLNLAQPYSPLIAQLTDRAGMMVSPKAAQALGDKFGTAPVCAGPFKFVERVPQDRIVLERFADYWDKGRIHFDKVVFTPIVDSTVRLSNLQSGGLEIAERVAATDLPAIRADKRLKAASIVELGYQGITFNVANGPRSKNPLGADARVRQAFSLAIDRAAITNVVYNGEFFPGNQWVPTNNPYYVKSVPVPKRDVARAKELLAEAGTPHPQVTLMTPPNPDILQVAQLIQAMTKDAGFEVKIQATEFAAALQSSQKGDFEAFLIAWSGRTDPDGNIFSFISCKGPLNDGHYCNEDVDKELALARTVEDPPERLKHYAKVEAIVSKELPIIYLFHRQWLWAMSAKLNGFVAYPDALIRPQDLKVN